MSASNTSSGSPIVPASSSAAAAAVAESLVRSVDLTWNKTSDATEEAQLSSAGAKAAIEERWSKMDVLANHLLYARDTRLDYTVARVIIEDHEMKFTSAQKRTVGNRGRRRPVHDLFVPTKKIVAYAASEFERTIPCMSQISVAQALSLIDPEEIDVRKVAAYYKTTAPFFQWSSTQDVKVAGSSKIGKTKEKPKPKKGKGKADETESEEDDDDDDSLERPMFQKEASSGPVKSKPTLMTHAILVLLRYVLWMEDVRDEILESKVFPADREQDEVMNGKTYGSDAHLAHLLDVIEKTDAAEFGGKFQKRSLFTGIESIWAIRRRIPLGESKWTIEETTNVFEFTKDTPKFQLPSISAVLALVAAEGQSETRQSIIAQYGSVERILEFYLAFVPFTRENFIRYSVIKASEPSVLPEWLKSRMASNITDIRLDKYSSSTETEIKPSKKKAAQRWNRELATKMRTDMHDFYYADVFSLLNKSPQTVNKQLKQRKYAFRHVRILGSNTVDLEGFAYVAVFLRKIPVFWRRMH